MFNTGVYKIEQLKDSKNLNNILKKDKRISITIFGNTEMGFAENDISEVILLNFVDERGAFKRTYSNRFQEFDDQALKQIQSQFSSHHNLIVHDVAVSDGRTACDFFEKLSARFSKLKYYASDYDPHIFILNQGSTKVVLNSKNIPIEIVFPPFVFNIRRDAKRYIFNHLIRFVLENTVVKNIILKYKNNLLNVEKRLLFCLRAMTLARNDVRFQLMQHDLLNACPFSQSVDVFRAMNILNPAYFTPSEFKIIIAHIFNALSDKGLLIIGSNQDSNTLVHGGIFQKANGRFEKIENSGDGSFIKDAILQYKADQ